MLKLGVNIDHVATVREARYRGQDQGEPCLIEAVRMAEEAGAHGITAHLREDRRHIQDRDIWAIREAVTTRLNFEMANTAEMIDMALGSRCSTSVTQGRAPRKWDPCVCSYTKTYEE